MSFAQDWNRSRVIHKEDLQTLAGLGMIRGLRGHSCLKKPAEDEFEITTGL